MCGIIFFSGDKAQQRIANATEKLRHRGPDDTEIVTLPHADIAIGFTRLAINGDLQQGKQPYQFKHLISACNGEIYNFRAIQRQLQLTGECDTHVIPALFKHHIPDVQSPTAKQAAALLSALDGFYSAVIYSQESNELFLLRDHMGKKPLFFGRSGSELFVTSELKSLTQVDWFELAPLGISKLALATGKLELISSHSTHNLKKSSLRKPNQSQNTLCPAPISLESAITQAVCKRLPTNNQPIGFFLSGGLDSSVVAAIARQHYPAIHYFTLGDQDSPDRHNVETLVDYWQLEHIHTVPVPDENEIAALLHQVVIATESYNPSVISNGLATYLLARAAKHASLKIVLTGEGADELFSGYHKNLPKGSWKTTRQQLIDDMHFTELRRLDSCTMAFGIEARCPFLDRNVKAIADQLSYEQCFSESLNKVALRQAFAHLLPATILRRTKTSFDVGSGIRRLVIEHLSKTNTTEKLALQAIWQQHFSHYPNPNNDWFHRYPVFDQAIAKRGKQHR